ncbi:hypothetical protein NQ318_005107, partial [Aromia moschata]
QSLVESHGYPFEAHEVVSESGHILRIHRIPHGMKRKRTNISKKPVVLFQHGLLSASDMWLFRGPDMDLREFKYIPYYKYNMTKVFNDTIEEI